MSNTSGKQRRLAILESFTHYVTAFVILLKGVAKLEDPQKMGVAIVFFIIGLLIILGTVFHHKAGKLLKHFKAYIFALEAIVIAIVGYLYMSEGKQFIQYVCFAASLMFVIALVVYISRIRKGISETHFG